MGHNQSISYGVDLDFLTLNYYVGTYPVFAFGWSATHHWNSAQMYTFLLDKLDIDSAQEGLSYLRRKKEERTLDYLLNGDTDYNEVKVRQDMQIDKEEFSTVKHFHLFGFLHRKTTGQYAVTRVQYQDEEKKRFHRYFYSSENDIGPDSSGIPLIDSFMLYPGILKKKTFSILTCK